MKVACALIIQNNKVMLARRPLNKSHGGHWEFPGGKLEPGEQAEAALCRELREELKVQVQIRELVPLGSVKTEAIELFSFVMMWSGVILPQEHMALAWSDLKTLHHFNLCESDRMTLDTYSEALSKHLVTP